MPAPKVRDKERSRTKAGRWRKKRSDAGEPRDSAESRRFDEGLLRAVRPIMKVNKIEETKHYGNIFDVFLPVRFFFNKDGSFDGIEITQEKPTGRCASRSYKRDEELIEELCNKLAISTGIEYVYRAEEKEEDG